MAYDIYGNVLRQGYCEVHPDVPEPYPCSECYQEVEVRCEEERMVQEMMEKEMRRQMEEDMRTKEAEK